MTVSDFTEKMHLSRVKFISEPRERIVSTWNKLIQRITDTQWQTHLYTGITNPGRHFQHQNRMRLSVYMWRMCVLQEYHTFTLLLSGVDKETLVWWHFLHYGVDTVKWHGVFTNLENMHVCVTKIIFWQPSFTENIKFVLDQRPAIR